MRSASVINMEPMRDVLDDLDDASVSTPDKLEGLGVTADGRAFMVTDNDGVDENYGRPSSSTSVRESASS